MRWVWARVIVTALVGMAGRGRQPQHGSTEIATAPPRDAAPANVIPSAVDTDDITELTTELAQRIRTDHPIRLDLPAIKALSPEVARIVASVDSGPYFDEENTPLLALGGLRSISNDAAAALATFPGTLRLDGLPAVDADLARVLATFVAKQLSLDGVTSLSPEAAAALAVYRGDLSLAGLRDMPPNVTAAFTTRPADTAVMFQQRPTVRLDGLESLAVESAEKLAAADRDVHLAGLRSLSPELARAILGGPSGIYLDGLTGLAPDIADIIAASDTYVSLNGIETLSSPRLERKLLRHYGPHILKFWDAHSLTRISP